MRKNKGDNNIVGLKELRNNIESYISKTRKGESFIVVRRSSPIFKVVPIDEDNESNWETIIDLTSFNKNGVSGKEVLKSLKMLSA